MSESLTKIADHIEKCRDKVWKEGPKLKVICGNCQKEMDRIGAQLEDGATRYVGYYTCHNDVTSVRVVLIAEPDLPYELYENEGKKKEKEK